MIWFISKRQQWEQAAVIGRSTGIHAANDSLHSRRVKNEGDVLVEVEDAKTCVREQRATAARAADRSKGLTSVVN